MPYKGVIVAVGVALAGLPVFECANAQTMSAQAQGAQTYINGFIGRWEGTAVAHYPRRPEREDRTEQVEMDCRPVLTGAYVECHSVWRQDNGERRELLTFWNVHPEAPLVEILYLYHDWPGKVDYRLEFDPLDRTLSGEDSYTASGGVPAKERVQWQMSADGNTLSSTEWNHWDSDAPDYWATSFEFTLHRCLGDHCTTSEPMGQ